MISVKIIEDSISAAGKRLTTFALTYPRIIHAELMTHRVFSRNAQSSRAIPVGKMIDKARDEMYLPEVWGLNQAGMQPQGEFLTGEEAERANAIWKRMAEACMQGVAELAEMNIHKQWANRPLEWFSHITVLVTATNWDNWYNLRMHPTAQKEIRELAEGMWAAHMQSEPVERGEILSEQSCWHLPFVTDQERTEHASDIPLLLKLSTARCARVTYLKHDGVVPSVEHDIGRHDALVGDDPMHASPAEHQGIPASYSGAEYYGNFSGYIQYRKLLEADMVSRIFNGFTFSTPK
ncbi:FAD-dependent thymidylate synthase [Methylobacillus sp.]|uniref:FAD-dependent thymidylate synthase n=1 Tax=Methylobacillus sp. TaxID=56818 RepID=UPI0012C75E77|nr:FAD-dependent thymidylate synthase [Methylobacillus sp.]MPS48491.1 hypothetical protein [Methylobacillus sp.]